MCSRVHVVFQMAGSIRVKTLSMGRERGGGGGAGGGKNCRKTRGISKISLTRGLKKQTCFSSEYPCQMNLLH